MNNKGVLIATFVKKNNVLSFIEDTKNSMNISSDKIFIYDIEGNESEYLASISVPKGVKASDIFEKPIIVHTKNGCIFSINALNKLIESIKNDTDMPNSEYDIEWDNYKSKLIMLNNGELKVSKLTKIEDKSEFLK